MITTEDAMKIRDQVIKLRQHAKKLYSEASTGMVHQIEDKLFDLLDEMTQIKAAIEKADK